MAIAGFNATYYVQTYPDVLLAISQGIFKSAEEHFTKYGAKEGRNPNAFFDSKYYLAQNPDVLQAVAAGTFASAYDHYIKNGGAEGRVPSAALASFDGAKYLAANADVQAAGFTDKTAVSHYVLYGAAEGRSGTSSSTGQTFTLTVNQDTPVGSDAADIFRGVAGAAVGAQDQTTLNSSDVIDGGKGEDVLVVNLVGGNYGGGATIKNIETLQIGTNDVTTTAGAIVTGARNFDYNVNAGSYEVTGVNTIVADQITRTSSAFTRGNNTETLTISNVTPTATGSVTPTLKWANENGSNAGVVGLTYRQASVQGTADVQKVILENVDGGVLNIGAGIETISIDSSGSAARNTLFNSDNSDTGSNNVAADIISSGSLTKVVLTGSKDFGKKGDVVASGTFVGQTDRNVTDGAGVGFDNGLTGASSASNLLSVGSRVTEVDASAATAAVNVRFTAKNDGSATNVTFKGGAGNDYVEFELGNVSVTGGAGADTFAFVTRASGSTNSSFGSGDTITGGEGSDTLQIGLNGFGSYTLSETEFRSVSGIDVLDLRGQTNTVNISSALVSGADAGKFEIHTDRIVQSSGTSAANPTTTTNNNLEDNSVNRITLTDLSGSQGVNFVGGSGSDRLVLNNASFNANMTLNGGTIETKSIAAGVAGYDTLTVVDSSVLDRTDLAGVSNFEGLVLVESGTGSTTFSVELTEAFLLANTASSDSNSTGADDRVFQILTLDAGGGNALEAGDTVTIDVTDLFTSANALKASLVGRQIDVTSLTNAGVTVQYAYKGTTYATTAALVAANTGLSTTVLSGNDATGRADIGASAAGAAVTVAPVATVLTATSNLPGTTGADLYQGTLAAIAGATVNGGNGTDTLEVTEPGTLALSANITNVEVLTLTNGTNTVTLNAAGAFTTVNGGTGNDALTLAAAVSSDAINAALGDGNDTLTLAAARTYTSAATLAGGNGTDTLTQGAGTADLSAATVTGFEVLNLTANNFTVGANSLLSQFTIINGTAGADSIIVNAGSHDISSASVTNFTDAMANVVNIASVATLTIAGDIQFGAGSGVTNFTGGGTLNTTGNLTFVNTEDTFTGNVAIVGGSAANFSDGAVGVARTITGNSANNTVTLGNITAAKTVNIASGGTDTIQVDAAGTGSAAVTIQGFQAGALASGGDILSLSYTAATSGFVNSAIATGANITAGGAAAVANIANVMGLSSATLQVSGAFTNAAVSTALAQGALVATTTHFYYVALDNGTDTAIYRFQYVEAAGSAGTIDNAADITNIQQVVVLTGIADVSALTSVNFA